MKRFKYFLVFLFKKWWENCKLCENIILETKIKHVIFLVCKCVILQLNN